MLNMNLPEVPNKHKLEHFLTKLFGRYEIECVILFGSTVKGKSNYRSDFDVLIISDDMGEDWFERNTNAFKLSIGLVQPFVLTKTEFEMAITNRQMIVWEALADGVIIMDNGMGKTQIDRFNLLIQEEKIKRTNQGWQIYF